MAPCSFDIPRSCGDEPTTSIYFELGGRCQLAEQHTRCPLNGSESYEILGDHIVFGTIAWLAKQGRSGLINWHNYNEPLLDDRLTDFIAYAHMRGLRSEVTTNGILLDQTMLDSLVEAGLTSIRVSLYTPADVARLQSLDYKIPVTYYQAGLDSRRDMYNRPETETFAGCKAPYDGIIVYRTGDVGLCCLDWARTITFGNLNEYTLEQVLANPDMVRIHDELSQGVRSLPVCKRCNGGR